MKTAKAFFNKNYVSNLSTSLKTLVQAVRLNEVGTDMFALSATEVVKLRSSLGL